MSCPQCRGELVENGPGLYICLQCEQLVREVDTKVREFYHRATGRTRL